MKNKLLAFLFVLVCGLVTPDAKGQAVKVPKTNSLPVYMHYMPWFESPETSGNWGWHWTMNNRNPNNFTDPATGRRDIASHYYPLIGPYGSSDPDVVEYHLLLMKLSGVDGVMIDWYGVQGSNGDINSLLKNSNALINRTDETGMKFGLILEDRFTGSVDNAKANITYAKNNYFNKPEYIRHGAGNDPVVGVFGPITFQQPWQWSEILSAAGEDVEFLPLWYEAGEAGGNADGEYMWIYQDAMSHYDHVRNYYTNRAHQMKTVMGVAYPGFHDFYAQGGAGSNMFYIPHNGGATLDQTLGLANQYRGSMEMLQLATFNDFGEGTIFEPTRETGYSYLVKLQKFTGVPYTENDLKQVHRLYNLRKQYKNDAGKQAKLNEAFNHFVALRINDAVTAMNCAEGGACNNNPVPQTPYSGTAIAIPGTVEAENFDKGGEGVAYHDNDASNTGGQYRTSEGIDIEACSEGGHNIGWTNSGEWLEYTVNVASAGTYKIDVRVASTFAGGTFHIEFGGVDKTGLFTVPNTGAWQNWTTVSKTGISLAAGTQVMRMYLDNANYNINKIILTGGTTTVPVTGVSVSPTIASIAVNGTQQLTATVTPSNATNKNLTWSSSNTTVATVSTTGLVTGKTAGTATITVTTQDGARTANAAINVSSSSTQTPYSGTAIAIPGTVETENFDKGGEGVAYHDNDASNTGGQYRTSEGIDIEACSEGGHNIGWTNSGEWLEYTVNVTSAGTYKIDVRVASTFAGGTFHIEFGGIDKTGLFTVPNTGAWQNWTTVSKTGISLTAGTQVMRLYLDNANYNINKIILTGESSGSTTYRIKNRWQNTYAYDAGDRVRYSSAASGNTYQWVLEDVAGVKELRNVGTGEYMHIENLYGYVQCTPRTAGAASSRWTIENVATGIVRFKNAAQTNHYIHIENLQNQVQHGTIDASWWSAQWILEPVNPVRLAAEEEEEETIQQVSVILSPNPVSQGSIKIQSTDLEGEVNVSISNGQGIQLMEGVEQAENAAITIDVSPLKAGTYIIRLQQGNTLIHKKFIVQ